MASKKLKLKPRRDNYALRDGRAVLMVPWIAKTAAPWPAGYARVFVPFSDIERRNARNGKAGHELIVSSSKLVRC